MKYIRRWFAPKPLAPAEREFLDKLENMWADILKEKAR